MKIKARSRKALKEAKLLSTGLAVGMATLIAAVLAALAPVVENNDIQNREMQKDMVIRAIHLDMERPTPTPKPTPGPGTMHVTQRAGLFNAEDIKEVLAKLLRKRPNDTGPRQSK